MPGEKRFRTSFMGGFNKADVNSYIEKILKEYDEKLRQKDDEIAALRNQSNIYKGKYEELAKQADQLNEDRAKIADVLITAREKAQMMLEEARIEALEEKKKLEGIIEKEKEKLIDIRKEMKTLKGEVVNTLEKYATQLGTFVKEDDDEDVIDEINENNEAAG